MKPFQLDLTFRFKTHQVNNVRQSYKKNLGTGAAQHFQVDRHL